MQTNPAFNRRSFLGRFTLGSAAILTLRQSAGNVALGADTNAGADDSRELSKQPLCIFTKHLQWLNYPEMVRTAAELGFEGLDLTVRPGGHVDPERVEDELPRAVDAARQGGVEIPMMATAVTDPRDPLTVRVLSTASRLGIRSYRMGYYRYDPSTSLDDTLAQAADKLKGLAEMNRDLGLTAMYQNHAGDRYVGAAIWDLHPLLKDLDPRLVGVQFDIRHATVEGGLNWPLHLRRVESHIRSLVFKDFYWANTDGGWEPVNCPLGKGAVDFPRFLSQIRKARISVPSTIHYEYPLGGAEHGGRELTAPRTEILTAMRRDLTLARGLLTG